jgi:regulator of protease activity HflC (stomatin/prohibitin superfamily)
MLDIGFFKGLPTEYIIRYAGGRAAQEGPGLSFYFLKHNTSIVAVPTSTTDANFVFNETTGNFQAVTIQGQFTYRIQDPRQAASLLNFTIDLRTRAYLSKDPERLAQRIANIIQVATRSEIQRRSLEETLRDSQAIAGIALEQVRADGLLAPMTIR